MKRIPSRGISPRQAAHVALFSGLTALGAFIRVPLPVPVPFTLQTPAVLLSGLFLGPRLGALSQVIYVITGLMGLPVFAQGGGPQYVLSPTFGFLLGFIGASATAGAIARLHRPAGNLRLLLSMTAGLAVLYLAGVAYFYWNLTFFQHKPEIFAAFTKFTLPFLIPLDILKILLLLPLIKILRRHEHLLQG